eukprot:CAMPEP_0174851992 /NCGR_PEP_ID=MMETSP1114-20130205/24894_1 /TAXON_ID=312471 /ORGANISM="Neobodo designis, Strain CCAP 1951/1" /LENGTH=81 /DNA_ID=CAMNT_0016086565 /DNA_START=48 /DNA_END=290 /DNA_ORIENTATION=+
MGCNQSTPITVTTPGATGLDGLLKQSNPVSPESHHEMARSEAAGTASEHVSNSPDTTGCGVVTAQNLQRHFEELIAARHRE